MDSNRETGLQIRMALLTIVDALEKKYDVKPTTAEIREWYKERVKQRATQQ